MPRAGHLICWAMALLVAMAPLPFGSVYPVPLAVIQVAVALLAAIWVTLRMRAGVAPLPWSDPLLIGGSALFVYGLLQITPMPVSSLVPLAAERGAQSRVLSRAPGMGLALDRSLRNVARLPADRLLDPGGGHRAAQRGRSEGAAHSGRRARRGGPLPGGLRSFRVHQRPAEDFLVRKGGFHRCGHWNLHQQKQLRGLSRNGAPLLTRAGHPGPGRILLGVGYEAPACAVDESGTRAFRGQGSSCFWLLAAFLMAIAVLMSRSRMGIIASVAQSLSPAARRWRAAGRHAALRAGVGSGHWGLAVLFASQIDIVPVVERFKRLSGEFGTVTAGCASGRSRFPC